MANGTELAATARAKASSKRYAIDIGKRSARLVVESSQRYGGAHEKPEVWPDGHISQRINKNVSAADTATINQAIGPIFASPTSNWRNLKARKFEQAVHESKQKRASASQ